MERFGGQGPSGIHLINSVLGLTNKIVIKNGTENPNCCICRLGTAESSCKKNCVLRKITNGVGVCTDGAKRDDLAHKALELQVLGLIENS